jgi:hypothetical protein
MKRTVALPGLGFVRVAGVAVAQQQTPAQPGPERGPQHMHGGMCPMMGGQADSPRAMQMRGEMMKAMGEVMIKYGEGDGGSGPVARRSTRTALVPSHS